MAKIIFSALWFFAPAGLANMAPVFAAHLPIIKSWDWPIDFNKTWRGQRVLGDHKTWRGLATGIVVGVLVVLFQKYLLTEFQSIDALVVVDYFSFNPVILGVLLGAGAIIGDGIKSFIKRQQGILEGESWLFFDQTDYIFGGIVFSYFYFPIPLVYYVVIVLGYFCFHLITTFLGYHLGLKKTRI